MPTLSFRGTTTLRYRARSLKRLTSGLRNFSLRPNHPALQAIRNTAHARKIAMGLRRSSNGIRHQPTPHTNITTIMTEALRWYRICIQNMPLRVGESDELFQVSKLD